MNPGNQSLNQVLRRLGYCTEPGRFQYTKDILDRKGQTVFSGDADAVWKWLRATGQIS